MIPGFFPFPGEVVPLPLLFPCDVAPMLRRFLVAVLLRFMVGRSWLLWRYRDRGGQEAGCLDANGEKGRRGPKYPLNCIFVVGEIQMLIQDCGEVKFSAPNHDPKVDLRSGLASVQISLTTRAPETRIHYRGSRAAASTVPGRTTNSDLQRAIPTISMVRQTRKSGFLLYSQRKRARYSNRRGSKASQRK